MGQRVISTLITFDTAKVAWTLSYKKLPYPTPAHLKASHALDWFHAWGDWQEAIERVSNHDFKSWLPHRLIHKGVRQIAQDGDLWAKSTSALEANQGELGRSLDKVASRRRGADHSGQTTKRQMLVKVSDGEEEDSDEDKPEPTWEPGKEMKVTKGMAYTATRHFVAAQNFRYDEENRISMREADRLVLGPEGRATSKRRAPKRLPDTSLGAVAEFIKLMNQPTGS